MGELFSAICLFIFGTAILTTPTPHEICNTLAKNNLTNSGHANHARCTATVEMAKSIKVCEFWNSLGTSFNDCIDEKTQAIISEQDSPEVKEFIQQLSENAKKEHKN